MDEQCPVDGCQNILHPQPAMNALSRRDSVHGVRNETYICGECGTMEGLEIKRGLTPSGALIIKTETTRSLLANNALHGYAWSYDLRAIAKEAGETGGLDFWAGEEWHALNVMTDEGMRVLKNFECMHSALDIVNAVYTSGGDEYRALKAAKLKERGLLYWSSDLDTSNLSRLVHLINLYARNGAR